MARPGKDSFRKSKGYSAIRRAALLPPALGMGLLAAAPLTAHAADTATSAPAIRMGATPLQLAQATTTPQTAAPAAPAAAPADATPPAPPAMMIGPIKFSVQGEAGVMFSPYSSDHNLNFGQLFTDKANQATLNQILLGIEKDIDPKATGFDWGFKFQGQYGSDSRYTHFLGELDKSISSRYQLDIIEADVSLHLPWLTEGGTDLKVGQYPTPLGYEVINPAANPFYSHSYIFNFGLPLKHTGAYGVTHVIPALDLYYGIDTGVNTTFGAGDNNGAVAGLGGIGLNLLDGNLTFVALTHFGPENPTRTVPNANSKYRYETDAYVTWKATAALSFTTEFNWIRDDAFAANAYGGAQYVSYAINDTFTLNGRAEIYRDQNNFFVASFPGNLDFVNSERGFPFSAISNTHGSTYSEFTAGVTWKPAVPAPIANFAIRPEIRYDTTLDGTKPYAGGKRSGAFSFGSDIILAF